MPRNTISAALGSHLGGGATTTCYLLKIMPVSPSLSPTFGLTTLDDDLVFDSVAYRSESGFNLFDMVTSADMSVDNTEAHCLAAAIPANGVTLEGISRGDYDNAHFALYLVNYLDLSMGAAVLLTGRVGEISVNNKLSIIVELRSLTQVLQQKSLIELTSITDRAKYGDERNKMPLYWYESTVASVSAEVDRTFTMGDMYHTNVAVEQFVGDGATDSFQLKDDNGNDITSGFDISLITGNGVSLAYTVTTGGIVTLSAAPAVGVAVKATVTQQLTPFTDYYVPGVVHWLSGANAGRENEIEAFTVTSGAATIVLAIPTREPISDTDTFKLRRDSDKSKARAIADNNLPNFRGEPELPRGDGIDLQAPTPGG